MIIDMDTNTVAALCTGDVHEGSWLATRHGPDVVAALGGRKLTRTKVKRVCSGIWLRVPRTVRS
jgi:hypothetical protein